jgi:hypothetical protein
MEQVERHIFWGRALNRRYVRFACFEEAIDDLVIHRADVEMIALTMTTMPTSSSWIIAL